MGTKINPGRFDCYAAAEPDEPMFILLGRDEEAADLVLEWATRREAKRGVSEKTLEARRCATAMREYFKKRG